MSECGICLCENTLFDSWRKIFRNHKLFSREVPGVFSPWPPGSRLMSHSWPSSREVVWPEDISQPVNHTQNQHWTWGCRGLTAKRVGAKCDVLKRVLFWSCEISSVNSQDYLRVVWQFTAFSDTVALQRVLCGLHIKRPKILVGGNTKFLEAFDCVKIILQSFYCMTIWGDCVLGGPFART